MLVFLLSNLFLIILVQVVVHLLFVDFLMLHVNLTNYPSLLTIKHVATHDSIKDVRTVTQSILHSSFLKTIKKNKVSTCKVSCIKISGPYSGSESSKGPAFHFLPSKTFLQDHLTQLIILKNKLKTENKLNMSIISYLASKSKCSTM